MSITYPTTLDTFVDPIASSPRTSPSLASSQTDQNSAIEALEAKVGVTSSVDTSSLVYRIGKAEASSTNLIQFASQQYKRGGALSGLEFGGTVPGTEGQDYFISSLQTFTYFAQKGLKLLRIAFNWERLQPVLLGALSTSYKAHIDTMITYAKLNSQKIVLEPHNFGRYIVISNGGFTDTFTSTSDKLWAGGTITAGSPGYLEVTDYKTAVGGTANNPVSPATTYSFQVDAKIVANLSSVGFEALWLEVFRTDSNNFLFFTMQNVASKWELSKQVNGTTTLLATASKTFVLGTNYTILIDVGQLSPGNISLKIDGTLVATVAIPAGFTKGYVAAFSNGVQGRITNMTLNVNGDTTSAIAGTGEFLVGSAQVPFTAFADLWTKIATAYKDEPTVLMYDTMNEWHDMSVETSPANYLTTATTTLANQAAIDAIRAVDTNKWIAIESTRWTGIQSFTNMYGANPQIWWTDPSNKTLVSWHYYQDSDHSGSYSTAYDASYRTRILTEVLPALIWAQKNNVITFIGEYGVLNGVSADAINWQSDMDYLLTIFDAFGVWATHWSGGDAYSSPTTLQPSTFAVDREQLPIIQKHLGYDPQEIVNAYKTNFKNTNGVITPVTYADTTNGRLGIMNATPTDPLTVTGTASIAAATVATAGGAAALKIGTSTVVGIYFGSGVPTISAPKGSLYLRTDGSSTSTRAYINTDALTTWTSLTTAA